MPPEPKRPYDATAFQADSSVSRETLDRLQTYVDLLGRWNKAINLVGKGTLADAWRRHILDSAQLVDLLPPALPDRPRRIVDLGSGAGFPGLVLAIMGAGEVHLIESDQRKATFLREVIRRTQAPATVQAQRIEAVRDLAADVVTARALASLTELVGLAQPFLAPGTVCLFPKGGEVARELTEAEKAWRLAVERFPSQSDPRGTLLRVEVLQS